MTIIDRNTKVELVGRGILTIRPNDHVATGGEGSVYCVADTVVKLYTDENKMRNEGIADKIILLAPLQSERIIAPEGLVAINGKPRGFYMCACDGDPLSLFFTNDFRRQKKITEKDTSILVDRMREVTAFSHAHHAIMGDPNEMNWFALSKGKGGPDPRIIDVDSWAIGKFPIRAVMPSVRDWHSAGFTELSDWFSWGVVTFQVYTGIHPYKGTLHGYTPGNMTERMKANASVFEKGVSLNKAVRDFSVIPARLLEWYRAVFQQGERTIPPSPFDVGGTIPQASIVKHIVTAGGTGLLVFEKIFGEVNDSAIKIFPCGVIMLQSGKLIRLADKRNIGMARGSECELVKTEGGWLKTEGNPPSPADYGEAKPAVALRSYGEAKKKTLSYSYIHENSFIEENLSFSLFGQRVFRFANRLFLVTDEGITELSLTLFGKPFLSSGKTWNVMTKSTVWFDGVGGQDAMGAMYAVLPFGDSACAHVRVRELDGLRIINGKAGNRFVSLVAVDKNGIYHKLEISFDAEYRNSTVWKTITDSPEQNLAILPKGVCATIITDGVLDVFVPSSGAHKKISDVFMTTDMALSSFGDTVVYLHNGDVWSLKMK